MKLLTPFLAPLEMQGLGWLPGHSRVFLAPSCSASVHVPSHLESYRCFDFSETRDWPCWLANPGIMSLAHSTLCPGTYLLALYLLLVFFCLPPKETQHMASHTPALYTSHRLHGSQQPMFPREKLEPQSLKSFRARKRLQDASPSSTPFSPSLTISSKHHPL